jgi:hypothetical protein
MTNRMSSISIVLSIICIVLILLINYIIALRFNSADGKTQALFGIIELTNYSYKYYFVLLSFISLVFAIAAKRRKEPVKLNRIAFILGIISLVLIFLRIWRMMT